MFLTSVLNVIKDLLFVKKHQEVSKQIKNPVLNGFLVVKKNNLEKALKKTPPCYNNGAKKKYGKNIFKKTINYAEKLTLLFSFIGLRILQLKYVRDTISSLWLEAFTRTSFSNRDNFINSISEFQ